MLGVDARICRIRFVPELNQLVLTLMAVNDPDGPTNDRHYVVACGATLNITDKDDVIALLALAHTALTFPHRWQKMRVSSNTA